MPKAGRSWPAAVNRRLGNVWELGEARKCFEDAAACLPDLTDSYINLITLYLSEKSIVSPNWIVEAEKGLRILDRLVPDNVQAAYLRSRLASTPEVGNYSGALKLLDPVADSSEKFFLQAEIQSNPAYQGREIGAATSAWEKAINVLTEPTQADLEHLTLLFEFVRREPELPAAASQIALEGARRLIEGGKCELDRVRGADWLTKLNAHTVAA